ncbi:MAG: ribonuclease P protein component [Chthonomonadaceae bacterium]|nr:ribonuclease P protein component [Chthonomonadaceae bacterium]
MRGPSKSRFDELFTNGLRVNGETARAHSLPGEGLTGIATAKRTGCHARRNRQKRRIREAVRTDGTPRYGVDIVFFVRPETRRATFAELREQVQRLTKESVQRWEGRSESQ